MVMSMTYRQPTCQFGYCCDGRPNLADQVCRVCGEPVCDDHLTEGLCPSPSCIERAALEREEAAAAESDALCALLAESVERAKAAKAS
jgi:hypothetical protein